jgi:hypothetical protein
MLNQEALERLGRHGTFKSRAIWNVRDGTELTCVECGEAYCDEQSYNQSTYRQWLVPSYL